MNLITPDSGLLFWMVLIFGLVFFLLAKFGFPIITGSVEKRNGFIDSSLRKAEEAEKRMQSLAEEQRALVEQTRREQAQIVRETSQTKAQILAAARDEAREEAARLLEKARTDIEAEKESALRDIRREVAELSVQVAEKVVRKDLSSDEAQLRYLNRIVDEISRQQPAEHS